MTAYYTDDAVTLHHGDSLDILRELASDSVDAVVTDPPYNLSFMAKPWDAYEGREDAGFAYWLSGLIDGEGHFAIKAHTRGTHAPYFALKLRADETATLERIRRTTGIGTITREQRDGGNDMVRWTVQDKAGCQQLVDLLDKYPLRAKKRVDYWTWREAVCEWTNRGRGNRWHGAADNDRMASLRGRIMDNRAYTEIPWSGHEFQDWCRLWTTECLRVLKPGGHLLAFGGSRTWHRLAAAVEDAGFEIRDSIAWLYGSGFPKSLDVSKAIDKAGGASLATQSRVLQEARERSGMTREAVAAHVGCTLSSVRDWEEGRARAVGRPVEHITPSPQYRDALADLLGYTADERALVGASVDRRGDGTVIGLGHSGVQYGGPATEAAQQWQGWGTALKPAFEPIVVGRKPLSGTVAGNVLEHGTGALDIDACRIDSHSEGPGSTPRSSVSGRRSSMAGAMDRTDYDGSKGRWPTNVVLDESQAAELDKQSGHAGAHGASRGNGVSIGYHGGIPRGADREPGSGGASRFFPVFKYQAKAPASERPSYVKEDAGTGRVTGLGGKVRQCNVCETRAIESGASEPSCGHSDYRWEQPTTDTTHKVTHPTVKPLELMRWLVRLVTPPGGTAAEACVIEGMRCIAIEREADYLPLIIGRLSKEIQIGLDLDGGAA